MKTIKIANEKLTVEIRLKGAEIASVKNNEGKEYIWDANPNVWANSAPIMFPICGGLKDDKYILDNKEYTLTKHGFIKYAEFSVDRIQKDEAVLVTYDTAETRKSYPYKFEFRVHFKLVGDILSVSFIIDNKTENEMYFEVGSHEAYSCPEGIEEYKVLFEKKEDIVTSVLDGNIVSNKTIMISKDSNELPLLYDYFAVDALVLKSIKSRTASLVKNDGSTKINIDFHGKDFLFIWTKPNAKYICIEPWSGLPDLEGSSYDFTEKFSIQKIDPMGRKTFTHKIQFEK